MKRRDHTLPFRLTPHETELLALWDAFAAEYHQSRHEFMHALTGKAFNASAIYHRRGKATHTAALGSGATA